MTWTEGHPGPEAPFLFFFCVFFAGVLGFPFPSGSSGFDMFLGWLVLWLGFHVTHEMFSSLSRASEKRTAQVNEKLCEPGEHGRSPCHS